MWHETAVPLAGGNSLVYVYKQAQNESCGAASLLTLIRQREGIVSAEAVMRLWLSQAERALQNEGESPGGKHAGTDVRVFDMEGGADVRALHRALATKKSAYNASSHRYMLPSLVGSCSPATPGILRVEWADTTAHFVVCLGTNGVAGPAGPGGAGPAERIFLDPWYGVVRNNVHSFPAYNTASGTFGAGVGQGNFTHLILTH